MTQYPPPHSTHTILNHPTMPTVPNGPTSSQTRLQIFDLFQKSLQMQNTLLSAVAQTALFEQESMDPSQYHQLSQQFINQVATQFHSSLRTAELSLHQLTYDLMQQQQQQMRDCWIITHQTPFKMENPVITESHRVPQSSLLTNKCPSSTPDNQHQSAAPAPLPGPPPGTLKRKFNETTLDDSTSSSIDASSANKRPRIKQENSSHSAAPMTLSSTPTITGPGSSSNNPNPNSTVPASATLTVTSSCPPTADSSQPSPSSPLQPSPTSSETDSFQPSPSASPNNSSSSPTILPLTSLTTSSRLFPHAITLPIQLTTSPLNSPQPLSLTRLSTGEQSMNTGIRMSQMSSPISSSLPLSQYQLLMQRQMRQRRGSNPDISPIPSSFGVSTGMTTHPKSHSPSTRAIGMPSSVGSFSWTGSESNTNTNIESGAMIEASTGQLRRPSFTLSSPQSGSRSLLPSWFTNNTSVSGGLSPESGGGTASESNTVTQLSSPTSSRLQSSRSSIFPSRSVGSTTTLLPPPAFSPMTNNLSLSKEAALIPVFSPRGGPVDTNSASIGLLGSSTSSSSNPPVLISTLQPPLIPMENNTNFELTLAPFGATHHSSPFTTEVSPHKPSIRTTSSMI